MFWPAFHGAPLSYLKIRGYSPFKADRCLAEQVDYLELTKIKKCSMLVKTEISVYRVSVKLYVYVFILQITLACHACEIVNENSYFLD